MSQNLKILSINFPFTTSWVVQEPTLATSRALFDFDAVVIRPYALVGSKPAGQSSIESREYGRARNEVTGKIEDIRRLLYQGGLLVVILDAVQELKFYSGAHSYSGGTLYTVTNYDFLDEHFFQCIRNGTGSRVEILDAAEPFSVVIRSGDVQWTAFISGKPPEPFAYTTFFARNGAGSFIGGEIAVGEGNVVFLPNFKQLDEEKFFEACREYRYRREGTPVPQWVAQVFLPGASDAETKIENIDDQRREIERLQREAIKERDELLAYKKLLYEKGRPQLEPTVRRALDQLGFATNPGETIPGTGFEIDGRTTVGSTPGILEIKGSKKQITLDEFGPFIPKILADLRVSGFASKGILIGNGLCEAPPQERLGKNTFSSHVLQAASTNSIALVNSVELYCVICGVISGRITNLEAIRETILTANGFAELRRFCSEPAFTTS